MCGIAGFYSGAKHAVQCIKAMTEAIRHRGPDDEGYVLFKEMGAPPCVCGGEDTPIDAATVAVSYAPTVSIGCAALRDVKVALGHRRLAVLDLSPFGHQPLCTTDLRYWIVYNGEVYNYIELRSELEKLGYVFASKTDTEVILAAYAEWGERCLSRFNGMWAFAIYDSVGKTLFLARDRFGVKPLYYMALPDGLFAFASEIKQFTVLPGWQSTLNGQRAYDYLVFGITDHTEETMFSGVYQLKPGHCVTILVDGADVMTPGRPLSTKAWYELRPRPFAGNLDDAAREFRDLFEQSLALRLRADVPVGSCLSGGLDSSSIVCVLNEFLRKQGVQGLQRTFSACSEVDRFDERKWIDLVVGKTGVDAHYVYPALDRLFEESPAITWHQDEPFGSTSIYAQWNVFKLAGQNGIKVMLDGQGADEQLCGYHLFMGARLSSLSKAWRFSEVFKDLCAMRNLHGYTSLDSLKQVAPFLLPELVVNTLKRCLGYYHAHPGWLNLDNLNAESRDPFASSLSYRGGTSNLSYAQLTSSNLQMLLHWEDRDSMAHSIESRVPFLDYRLVEFVLGLPEEYKIYRGVTKRVLREAMTKILPEAIRTRVDKMGFVTPEEVWVREIAPEMFRSKIEESIEVAPACFDAEALRNEFANICRGKKKFSFLPWRIINFGEWVRIFNVSM